VTPSDFLRPANNTPRLRKELSAMKKQQKNVKFDKEDDLDFGMMNS
jgi:hypothetical protein